MRGVLPVGESPLNHVWSTLCNQTLQVGVEQSRDRHYRAGGCHYASKPPPPSQATSTKSIWISPSRETQRSIMRFLHLTNKVKLPPEITPSRAVNPVNLDERFQKRVLLARTHFLHPFTARFLIASVGRSNVSL